MLPKLSAEEVVDTCVTEWQASIGARDELGSTIRAGWAPVRTSENSRKCFVALSLLSDEEASRAFAGVVAKLDSEVYPEAGKLEHMLSARKTNCEALGLRLRQGVESVLNSDTPFSASSIASELRVHIYAVRAAAFYNWGDSWALNKALVTSNVSEPHFGERSRRRRRRSSPRRRKRARSVDHIEDEMPRQDYRALIALDGLGGERAA